MPMKNIVSLLRYNNTLKRWNKKKGFHWKAALGPCETCSAPLIAPAGVASVCTVKRGKSMCTQTCEAADHVFRCVHSYSIFLNLFY